MKIARFFFLLLFFHAPLRAGTAILWIPREHTPIDDVITRLETGGDFKLTIAPGEIPAALAERIKALSAKGLLELTARPAGDPPIPLLYYPREDLVRWRDKPSSSTFTNDPFFIALRMGDARDAAAKSLKPAPEGFVSPPGGIVAEYIPLARALGFKWLAAGPLISTAPFDFINAEDVAIIPFSTNPAAAQSAAAEFLVFDETSDGSGADSRTALLAFLAAGAGRPYMTVSEALKTAVSTALPAAQAAQLTTPWSGDYTPWAGRQLQAGALTALASARGALMAHLNAKQGDYKAAKPAFDEYFFVESGPKPLKLGDPDADAVKETEIEIQNSLGNAYRLMDKTPPGWLFSTLADAQNNSENADKVTIKKSSAGFTLVNASNPPAPPAGAPADPKDPDPYRIWKLAEVNISWAENEVVFSFSPLEAPPTAAAAALSPARFDLYIDINNRARAGAARLLEGRSGRIFPDNAWEYTLEVSAKKASLYAATTKGPQNAGNFKTDFENGSFTVHVPRTALRGNPGLWGYTAFMLYTPDDKVFSITDFLAEDFSNGYYYAVRPAKKY
jgi:hypothetical protein